MQVLYAYIIKSFVVSLLMIGYYWIFLRNNRFHQYNRFYLLGSLLLSSLLPIVKFNWFVVDEKSAQSVKYVVGLMQSQKAIQIPNTGNQQDQWILFFYLGVCVFTFLVTVIGIIRIYILKKKSTVRKMEGIDFMETEYEAAPFSFLNNVFWRRNIDISSKDGQKIFKHELAHVREHHTYDKLFCNLVLSICWINPVYWVIRYELNNIHEFIADEQSLHGVEVSEFSRLLLSVHFDSRYFPAGQNFFHSSIKRRLNMFKKSKKTKFSYLRRLMVLPLLILTISLFSFSISEEAAFEIDQTVRKMEGTLAVSYMQVNDTLPTPGTPPLATPPNPPLVPKKPHAPKAPGEKKLKITKANDGTAYDSVVIVHGKGKEITKFNPITLNGLNNGESIVVWNGNQVYTDKPENLSKYDHRISTIDIMGPEKAAYMFGYKGQEKITVIHLKPEKVTVKPNGKGKKMAEKALIILEGKEITSEEMNKLDQNQIESVNVWKGEKAIEKYGTKGEKGVIEIKLKKQ